MTNTSTAHISGSPTVAFYLGPIPISAYGIMILLSFLAVSIVCWIEWRKKGYHWFHFFSLLEISGFFALFGARWWYLAFNPSDYSSFFSLFAIGSGRSILGSIFFIYLTSYFYVKFFAKELPFRQIISILLPTLLLGQAIGRWGNFFDHNIYGPIAPGGLTFLPAFIRNGMYITDPITGVTAYRQPLFLYESILDLFGFLLILFILKPNKTIKPGVHAGCFFLYYGTIRASLELFRSDPNSMMHIGKVPTSFVLALLFALFGLWLIIYYQKFYLRFFKYREIYLYPYFLYQQKLIFLFFNHRINKTNKQKQKIIYYNEYNKVVEFNSKNFNWLFLNLDEKY